MTEIALRQTAPPSMTLPEKIAYCEALSRANALPAQYRGKPHDLLFAVEYAGSLGLHPIAAITGIHVIEGKPSASAALISMLVRRAGHKLRVTGDAQAATCEIIRADDPGFTFRVTWTMEDARAAGLAGKDVWKKYAGSMLKARAVSQCARDAAEDALFGLHYTPEEVGAVVDQDGNPVEVEPDRPTAPAPRSPAPAPTGWSGDRYDSPQQSASQTPAPVAPVARTAPEPMPDDLRELVFAAWSDLDVAELRKVFALCKERGVGPDASTADDKGEPVPVRWLFEKAALEIARGERPANADQPAEPVVEAVVVDEPQTPAPRQKRAERLPQVPEDDPWYADQPEPVADGSHPMDLPIPEPVPSPSAAARDAARNATRRTSSRGVSA